MLESLHRLSFKYCTSFYSSLGWYSSKAPTYLWSFENLPFGYVMQLNFLIFFSSCNIIGNSVIRGSAVNSVPSDVLQKKNWLTGDFKCWSGTHLITWNSEPAFYQQIPSAPCTSWFTLFVIQTYHSMVTLTWSWSSWLTKDLEIASILLSLNHSLYEIRESLTSSHNHASIICSRTTYQ